MLAKLSLLLLLYRIFKVDRKFRIASWMLGIFFVVWSIVTLLLCIFSCRPIKATWDLMLFLDPKTRCEPKMYNVINIHGFCNIISDFALLILPIPMIWSSKMTINKKIGVGAVFATGAL